jgi:hypothetical protein
MYLADSLEGHRSHNGIQPPGSKAPSCCRHCGQKSSRSTPGTADNADVYQITVHTTQDVPAGTPRRRPCENAARRRSSGNVRTVAEATARGERREP